MTAGQTAAAAAAAAPWYDEGSQAATEPRRGRPRGRDWKCYGTKKGLT